VKAHPCGRAFTLNRKLATVVYVLTT
jgi:hypothetical protein